MEMTVNTQNLDSRPDGAHEIAVDAWINGAKLAYWCHRCERWHGNNYDPDESDPILRSAPHCSRDEAEEFRLEVCGEADADLRARICRDAPPAGVPHPGKLLNLVDDLPTILLAHFAFVKRQIESGRPAISIAEHFDRGQAIIDEWDRLTDLNPRALRDLYLKSVVDKACAAKLAAIGDLIAADDSHDFDPAPGDEVITPGDMRRMLTEDAEGLCHQIAHPEFFFRFLTQTAWEAGLAAAKARIWRAMSPAGSRPIRARAFWNAYSATIHDHKTFAEAVRDARLGGEG